MFRKVLTGIGTATALTTMFLLGSLAVGPVFAQAPQPETGRPAQAQVDEQQPAYGGSILLTGNQAAGLSEADEATALAGLAKITAKDAEAAAVAANPGASVTKSGLDDENGVLVYSVELSNGMDVKIDAGTCQVLHTEQADGDASEVAGAENAMEQQAAEN